MTTNNPLTPFLANNGTLILDGGLASELEYWGYDLNHQLWSAHLLHQQPAAIRDVHLAYLRAGADCLITASYQATIAGFMQMGHSAEYAQHLITRAVTLAQEARDMFWREKANRLGRHRPLIAASIGPYAAYLADGSEYTGLYNQTSQDLFQFHYDRWHLLATTEPDIFACETIPNRDEAHALGQLLTTTPHLTAWFSFACQDPYHLNDGTPLIDLLPMLNQHPQIVALGVNCTHPRHIPALIQHLRPHTNKPIIAYPNSGETYSSDTKQWSGSGDPNLFGTFSREWRKAGATIIGGCCRTRPAHIQQIADRLRHKPK
ncbi:MAG TPA: homocysteine S-methyltransferase [Anaerolineae bacterium]|nr:homocysteine S-methyltransferase [Anaerolineae bacterium]